MVCSTFCSGADQRKHQSSATPGLCEGNSPVTGEFPSQKASNAENVSIWWRHHENGRQNVTELRELVECNIIRTTDNDGTRMRWHHEICLPIFFRFASQSHDYSARIKNLIEIDELASTLNETHRILGMCWIWRNCQVHHLVALALY